MRVAVWVNGEKFELTDSLIVCSEGVSGPRTLQLFSDAQRQWARWTSGRHDYAIEGEWDDRERDEAQFVYEEMASVVVDKAYSVWETETHSGYDYLIAVLLVTNGKLGPVINLHLDDVSVSSVPAFWDYMSAIVPQTKAVAVQLI